MVFAYLAELYPTADLFALVHDEAAAPAALAGRRVETSWLQRLPGAKRAYRYYLPLLPLAAESLELLDYDLVISNSSGVVKGVLTHPEALHVCHVLSPMRYIWDLAPDYFPPRGLVNRFLAPPLLSALRCWDVTSSQRVDRFVSISSFVAARVRKYYRRSSTILHPPIDCARFAGPSSNGEAFLMVSALVESKGVELAVEAFRELGLPLRIVGEGPLGERLRRSAPANVEFLGWISDDELVREYHECRAFLHCAVEDFGLAPIEAMAAGKPVVALGRGGVLDTIVPWRETGAESPTGLFFEEREPASLVAALRQFEAIEGDFEADALRRHAQRFDRGLAGERFKEYIESALCAHRGAAPADRGDATLMQTIKEDVGSAQ